MFAEKAYSPHGLFLMATTIFCVLSGAVLLSYAGIKLYKRPLYWLAAGSLFFPIVFATARYLLLTAPTQTIFDTCLKLQTFAGIASVIASFTVLIALITQKYSAILVFGMAVPVFLSAVGSVAVLQTDPVAITDFFPVASFVLFSGYYCWFSQKLFPELSTAPEALLNESNDIVFVFDERGRLMRASPNSSEVLRVRENMMREEFDAMLNESAILYEDNTLSLTTVSGIKYYQSSETTVKKKGNTPLATVLMFSDVTEITALKAQLNKKNEELEALNTQLDRYIKISERLEAEEQKEMAVLELKRAIGHRIEELTQGIEAADAPQNLTGLIEACRDIMAGVRQAVFRLANKEDGGRKDD